MTDRPGAAPAEADEPVEVPDEPTAAPGRRAVLGTGRLDLTLTDVAVAAAALLLLIPYAPGFFRGSSILVTMVVWPLGAVGLVGLAVLARRGDAAARWGSAFVVVALLAALVADVRVLSLLGGWSVDHGWAFLASYVGIWAVGRRVGTSTLRAVTAAVVFGLLFGVLVAFVQATTPDGVGLVALTEGRASGFTQNPVFFGGLMAGAVPFAASHLSRSRGRWWAWLPVVLLFASGAYLSGSRIAMAAAVAFGLLAAWGTSHRPERVAAVLVAVALGLALGWASLPSGGGSRVADSEAATGGFTNRIEMWKAGADAMVERPVLGWGPGRFRTATNPRITLEFVQAEGPYRTFSDAHNIFVELGVTTGLAGVVLATGFLWCAARRARGPMAWLAAGVGVSTLVAPLAVTMIPIGVLALGLAGGPGRAGPDDPPVPPDPPSVDARRRTLVRVAAGGLGALAVVAPVLNTLADRRIADAVTADNDAQLARQAVDLVPWDPGLANIWAQFLLQDAVLDPSPEAAARALAAAEEQLSLDRNRSLQWVDYGNAVFRFSDGTIEERYLAALPAWERALELHPYSVNALTPLWRASVALERDEDEERYFDLLCLVDRCPDR